MPIVPRRTAWILAAALALAGCREPAARPPSHLLMIVMDTLRADALGTYGSDSGATPRLDALSEQSRVFEHAWAQGTYTASSFVAYMTSSWVRSHGFDFHPMRYPESGICGWKDLETLAEVLHRNGFETTALVANPVLHPQRGFPRGFDTWNGLRVASLATAPELDTSSVWLDDARVVADAADALRSWRRHARRFLYVHLMAPHLPLVPSREASERFGIAGDDVARAGISLETIRRWRAHSGEAEHALTRRAYAASVWDGDREVGEILDALDATGLADATVVVFLSDHGELLWEHGDYGHRAGVWEALARVPLMIRAPGVLPGRVRGRTAALIDLAPTLLELLGISERPAAWEGESLLQPSRRDAVFTERYAEVAVTHAGRVKAARLVGHDAPGGSPWRWFDLRTDPGERRRLETGPAPGAAFPAEFRVWAEEYPRPRRDLEAAPVGICGSLDSREAAAQRERLRALGYLEGEPGGGASAPAGRAAPGPQTN